MREAAGQVRGAHAVLVASKSDPGKLVAFRAGNAGGIVVGYGQGEIFLASDPPALLPHTRDVVYLGRRRGSFSADPSGGHLQPP